MVAAHLHISDARFAVVHSTHGYVQDVGVHTLPSLKNVMVRTCILVACRVEPILHPALHVWR